MNYQSLPNSQKKQKLYIGIRTLKKNHFVAVSTGLKVNATIEFIALFLYKALRV